MASDDRVDLDELVEAAEPNPLLRRIDGLVASQSWDSLVALADRCRKEVERGKQLWPIAEHVDYRLALDAPGEYAAAVLGPESGRFSLGPLTEVAASKHRFAEVADFLDLPIVLGLLAGECVVRGEDLSSHPKAHPEVVDLPLRLCDWEPAYSLATYKSDEVTVAEPEMGKLAWGPCPRATGTRIEDPEFVRTLFELVAEWVERSNCQAEVEVVEGTGPLAVAALDPTARIAEISPSEALSLMAWAAASGGAHGRRRGAAVGRFLAWSVAATALDLAWPVDPEDLGEEIATLKWYVWDPVEAGTGWSLHLGIHDPSQGWAAAIGAIDRA